MIPKYYIFLLTLIMPTILFSQDYYWYGHNKASLTLSDKKFVVIESTDRKTTRNVVDIVSQLEFNNLNQSTLLYSAQR